MAQGYTDKQVALANFLRLGDLSAIESLDDESFSVGREEYLVLFDEEADERCKNEIRELLWAFKADFLDAYIDCKQSFSEVIQKVQEDQCESCNEMIYRLVKDRFDDLVDDAISSDGRGHFLSGYDGEENEEGEFYIYRTN